MTGSFGLTPMTHERAVLELDDGSRITYRDVRRFEPGSSSRMPSSRRTSRRRTAPSRSVRTSLQIGWAIGSPSAALRSKPFFSIKGSSPVSGTYADEALLARASTRSGPPTVSRRGDRECSSGDSRRFARRDRSSGLDVRDYATPDGEVGSMQDEFRVYGRDGKPCPRCHHDRKGACRRPRTWFCPRCQPLPPAPAR
jgi:formamidopyrimidine-DNA glycosylase